MDSMGTEAFAAAFALLDTSGSERVKLAQIQDFVVASGAHIGDPSVVTKLFQELDTAGKGEIASDKFLTLCLKLEMITKVSVKNLVEKYMEVQYKRLFALVLDDPTAATTTTSTSGEATVVSPTKEGKIHKEEFRRFIGDCERVLSVSIADVSLLLRDFPDSLDFRCFAEITARLIKGKSIAAIVSSFSEATRRRRENRQLALSRFQGATTKAVVTTRFRTHSFVMKDKDKPLDRIFEDAFQLLDSRGGGVVSLDAVYEFCESFPTPPPQSTIRKIYNQFDTDGSGDIDRDEFQAFCKGLEHAVNIPMADMCSYFTQAMFKRLYELVDEEGDGNDTVSKEELKQLLEAIRPALSSKLTGQEIYAVIREQEGDLNFDDFCHVIGKITAGISISKVVTVFEQQLRKRRAAKRKALQQFESGVFIRERSQSSVINPFPMAAAEQEAALSSSQLQRFCIECAEKEDKIKRLESEMERMRSELQNLKNAMDSEPNNTAAAASAAQILNEDELQGDVASNLHVPINALLVPFYRKFPKLAQPAIAFVGSERLVRVATIMQENFRRSSMDVDGIAKQINASIQQLTPVQKQLQILGDSLLDPIAQAREAQMQILAKVEQFQLGTNTNPNFASALDAAAQSRAAVKELEPHIEAVLDAVLKERRELAHLALTAAASSGNTMQIVTCVVSMEQGTQRLIDFFTLALRLGSAQLSDAEIFAKRITGKAIVTVSPSDVERLKESTVHVLDNLNVSSWSSSSNQCMEAVNNLRKMMTTVSLSKRDKAVNTVDDGPTRPNVTARCDPNANKSEKFALIAERSTSPRVRVRREKPHDMLAHVDSLLANYRHPDSGVQLPSNFSRVDPSGNIFYFGTKKIEIGSVEKFLTVKVGGGYLLLEEFCQRYASSEARRLDNFLCAPGVGRIAAPGGSFQTVPSTLGTPRFATASAKQTPRGASSHSVGDKTPRAGSMSANSPRPVPPLYRQ